MFGPTAIILYVTATGLAACTSHPLSFLSSEKEEAGLFDDAQVLDRASPEFWNDSPIAQLVRAPH